MEITFIYDKQEKPLPEYGWSKHIYTPGRNYQDVMPKIEVEIKIHSIKPEDLDYLSELFEHIYRKIEVDTLKRGESNGEMERNHST